MEEKLSDLMRTVFEAVIEKTGKRKSAIVNDYVKFIDIYMDFDYEHTWGYTKEAWAYLQQEYAKNKAKPEFLSTKIDIDTDCNINILIQRLLLPKCSFCSKSLRFGLAANREDKVIPLYCYNNECSNRGVGF